MAGSTTNVFFFSLLLNKPLILKTVVNSCLLFSYTRSRYRSGMSVSGCVVPDVLKKCSVSIFRDKQYKPISHSRWWFFRILGTTHPKTQCHIHCGSHKIPCAVSCHSNSISLMKQQFVLTPHNLSNWDSHVTRVLGYKHVFCQNRHRQQNCLSLHFRKNITCWSVGLFGICQNCFCLL